MVGQNGVDNGRRFAVTLGQIGSDEAVGALHFMVHSLADVVEKPGPLGLLDVLAQFGGHDAAEEGHFQGVLQDILGVAGAVFELADVFDQFGMDGVNPHVKGGLLPGFLEGPLHLLGDLAHYLLNARRVDAPVGNEAFQGQPGYFPPQGGETGEDDSFRSVINDQIHPGGRLNSPDVAPFPADDAALHLIVGQGHHGNGVLGHIVPGVAFDGQSQDFTGLFVGRLPGFRLHQANEPGSRMAGLFLHIFQQQLLGLGRGK